MNIEQISSIARSRREALLREAALVRAARRAPRIGSFRLRLASAARAMGYACLTLGEALAGGAH